MPRSFLVKKAERVKVDKSSFFCDDIDDDDDVVNVTSLHHDVGYHGTYVGYHDYSSPSPTASPVTTALTPYTPELQPLAVRLANGYIHDLSPPQMYTTSDAAGPIQEVAHDYSMDSSSNADATTDVMDLSPGTPKCTGSAAIIDNASNCSVSSSVAMTSPTSPSDVSSVTASSQSGDEESQEERKIEKGGNFQKGITVGYTYDAFFITDGRSRKKNMPKESKDASRNNNNNNDNNSNNNTKSSTTTPEKNRAKYSCNECGKQYATSSNLSRHKQTHRSLDSKNAKKCPHCNKVYVSMPALSMHILTHDLRHSCPVCDKSFSRPWLLQGHLRSHSGEKPYGCAHCGKAFADRSNLRAHMQTHSSYKDFRCKRCDKTFALKSYLNKHYESACFKEGDSEDSPCSPESTTSSQGSV